MRGDPPFRFKPIPIPYESTPHARGSTPGVSVPYISKIVYPACAGIHLGPLENGFPGECLPRMRGDPPQTEKPLIAAKESTPHARGSTLTKTDPWLTGTVYPACAGIHPCSWTTYGSTICLPRMRGDPPVRVCLDRFKPGSTPHARGSTSD